MAKSGAWACPDAEVEHAEHAIRCEEASGAAAGVADADAVPVLRPFWGCWAQAQHYSADRHDPPIHCSSGADTVAIEVHCC